MVPIAIGEFVEPVDRNSCHVDHYSIDLSLLMTKTLTTEISEVCPVVFEEHLAMRIAAFVSGHRRALLLAHLEVEDVDQTVSSTPNVLPLDGKQK
jgi:hypothetical protein